MIDIHRILILSTLIAPLAFASGCGKNDDATGTTSNPDGTHTHADGTTHSDHDDADEPEDHMHDDEISLGSAMIGDLEVEFAQSHGAVEPGREGHLVVKLPYSDNGATVIRAWIGTEDRTMSLVGRGEYAASHDDYDIHAMAPDPLPGNVMWWVEIEKPDGTKLVGSVKPHLN